MTKSLEQKYLKLQNILRDMKRVLIAFSGGTDSALLLKVAKDALKADVLAVTALSDTMPRHELKDAVSLAKALKVIHIVAESHEMEIPEFVKNSSDRCYICKKSRFGDLAQLALKKAFPYVADGENLDDQGDYRPGTRAAKELSIRSPLREAGLTKADIRVLSERLGLPTWNKPAYACLASRIPYHRPITAEKLRQVDEGEIFLRGLGLGPQLRVRHYDETARIELVSEDIPKLAESGIRNRVVEYFKAIGFQFVTLDMEGYCMGSLNRGIK